MNLPSGTVTFLFTDIEGSAKRWEQYPDSMRQDLSRHDTLLEDIIEQHNGYVFKTMGDAFCAAFARDVDALNAALGVQLALQQEGGETADLRVRIALHTGTADERKGDYFGPSLNRVARLLNIGHGGQTLLSQASFQCLHDSLPPGTTLRDLGSHRLRDLQQPEHVWQLCHPNLPTGFPPLRSLNALRHNLRIQMTSFIGRERAIVEVKRLLSSTRLLTLTGSGGVGKTRLALQVAADLLDDYEEGVWLVELAALSEPALVVQAVAQVMGVLEEPGQPLIQTLAAALKSRKLLLLLDNCEHLLSASVHLSDTLLRTCPNVKLLASSREGLGIDGELIYCLPSLTLPDPYDLPPTEAMGQYEAVRLLIERAKFHQPKFTVTAQNASAVAHICHRLDGIPLAIELAAARVRALTVEQIAIYLDDRFRLLTGGSRTALPRHQTLRALIDWSYDLLSDPERILLARLSVFVGGWTLDAAEAVCADQEAGVIRQDRGTVMASSSPLLASPAVLDLLTRLVDKSLVIAEASEGAVRYRLLEMVRQYGQDRLLETGQSQRVRQRHSDYFLRLVEAAPSKCDGAAVLAWLERLENEYENLRVARAWSLQDPDAEVGLRLVAPLWQLWEMRGHLSEGRAWLTEALYRASGRSEARAMALHGAGMLAWQQGNYADGRSLLEESLAIQRERGNRERIAAALLSLGEVISAQGDYDRARALYEESLAIAWDLGEKWGLALAHTCLGHLAKVRGDYKGAQSFYEEALALFKEPGNDRGVGIALTCLGNLAKVRGDYKGACSFHEEALARFRKFTDTRNMALALNNLGNVAKVRGDYNKSQSYHEQALALFRELGDRRSVAQELNALGNLNFDRGDYAPARALFEEGLSLLHKAGDRRTAAVAWFLLSLGHVARCEDEYAAADAYYKEGLALFQELGIRWGIPFALHNLGHLARSTGDWVVARTHYQQSLELFREFANSEGSEGLAASLEGFSGLAAAQGHFERAVCLHGASASLRQRSELPLAAVDRAKYDHYIEMARSALGEEAFAQRYAVGCAMTLDQSIEYTLQDDPE